ncbi:hypothetical protein DFJ73DRAFT_609626, partial [Zopfochytrium polystomum]
EYIAITALSFSSARLLLFYSASVLSLGVLPIVCKYYPPLWAFLARAPCSHFRDADFVLVLCRDGAYQEIPVERIISKIPLAQRRQRSFTFFEYKKQRYVFREGTSTFQRMSSTLNISASDIHNLRRGMPGSEALSILQRNGPNTIDVDPVPIWQLLYDKTLHPFYLFQIASVIIWTYELYYLYAILIAVTSSASVFWEIYLTKYNETTLREYIEPESFCTVLRDGEPTVISTHHLVVGDAVLIDEAAAPAVADMVLVQGSCIVDESSLTGESVPVVKSSLDIYDRGEERYRPEGRFKDCTIFGGSKIVEVKPMPYGYKPQEGDCTPRAIGIVTATGFNSTKGELFRSILYPNRIDFKFYRDSVAFVGVLGVIALIAFINRLSLDLITIAGGFCESLSLFDVTDCCDVVPPALPLVLTVGATMALRRLKSKGIFCICPDRINYAGRIDTFCWDKTGTLTSSKVELHGLEPCENRRLLGLAPSFRSRYRDEQPTTFEEATAVCNSLSSVNGELVGSPIDLELFRAAAGWTLNQLAESVTLNGRAVPVLARAVPPKPRPTSSAPSSARTSIASRPSSASHQQTTMSLSAHDPSIHDPTALLVLRRFPFDAQLQRASVVYAADDGTARLRVAVKGSPEAVRILCRPNTLPLDYYEAVSGFAASGFYVLAVASRDVDASCQATPDLFVGSVGDLCREQVERDLKFEGFAVFKNPLKADSAATIAVLKDANIQNVIITGDSAMTAISVARDLELCRDVLLVDVFERGLGVRLLPLEAAKKSPQSSTFPTAVAAANTSETESTTSSLTRQRPRSATLHSSMDQLALPAANSHRNVQRRILMVGEHKVDDAFLDWVIGKTRVFARARPDQKSWIVRRLMGIGRHVGMCGDGANDTGALKAAHVGLALSEAEASIVAPFTSVRKRVSDVPALLAEGRCALETSFMAFKYMFMYPIVQLYLAAIVNQLGSGLSGTEFLFDDTFVVLVLALLMLRTGPSARLIRDRPTDTLFSPLITVSLGGHVILCLSFFAINLIAVAEQPWFCSAFTAVSGVDPFHSWSPLNASAPSASTYPCYPI